MLWHWCTWNGLPCHAAWQGPGFIDLDAVEAQVRRVLRERQQLIVVPGSHHVADHPHVAQAIHQALRTDTVFAPGKSGAFESIHRVRRRTLCAGDKHDHRA